MIIHILTAKLDKETKREWRAHSKPLEEVLVGTLTDFLEERCLILKQEHVKLDASKPQGAVKSERKQLSHIKKSEQSNSFAVTSSDRSNARKCAYCQEESTPFIFALSFRH